MPVTLEELRSSQPADEAPQPAGLKPTLYPFQRQGLHWLIEREKTPLRGGILSDEMGLGKTVELIGLIMRHPRPASNRGKATLIVHPATLGTQWAAELQKHAPSLTVEIFQGSQYCAESQAAQLRRRDVILVSYEVLAKEVHRARARQPLYPCYLLHLDAWRVILDEVQYGKSTRNAGRTARLIPTTNTWAVSGTPLGPRGVADVLDLLTLLGDEQWFEAEGWAGLAAELDSPVINGLKSRQTNAKRAFLAKLQPLFLRRTKEEVQDQLPLPPRHVKLLHVGPTEAERFLRETFVLRAALECKSALPDDVLRTHLQLSALSPRLWMAWPGPRAAAQRQSAVAEASQGSTATASRLVGELAGKEGEGELWMCMRAGAAIEFKKKRAQIKQACVMGLVGMLDEEEDEGVAEGTDREAQLERLTKCRIENGARAAAELTYLQLLTAVSTMARLTLDGTTYMVLANVFDYLTMGRDPHGVAWAAHPIKKRWLHGLEWRNKTTTKDNEVGPHSVGCANESFVPPGVPRRWADLAPLMMLRFRKFTPREQKEELHRALGHEGNAAEATLGFAIRVKSGETGRGGALRERIDEFDAYRLLCLRSSSATALPFALAAQKGDEFRVRLTMRQEAFKHVKALGQAIDRYPYVLPAATEETLCSLLAEPPLADAPVTFWPNQHEWLGVHSLDLWGHDGHLIAKLREPLREVVEAAGCRNVEWLATKVRKKGDQVRKACARFLLRDLYKRAAEREVLALAADRLKATCKRMEENGLAQQKMRQVSGQQQQQQQQRFESSKILALEQLLARHPAEKFVVFTSYKPAIPLLVSHLSCALGDSGSVVAVTLNSKKERECALSTFASIPSCRAIVLCAGDHSSGASAAGLTLTAATHVVLMDVLTNPQVEQQAISRVHRCGQAKPTTTWHVLSRGSADVVLRRLGESRGKARLGQVLKVLKSLPYDANTSSAETSLAAAADGGTPEGEEEVDAPWEEEGVCEAPEEVALVCARRRKLQRDAGAPPAVAKEAAKDEPSRAGPSQSTPPRGADGRRTEPYGAEVRCRRVRVWWDGDKAWYSGVVAEFSEANGKHLVRYDDGDTQWDSLHEMEAQGLLTWPSAEPETSGKKRKRA